MTAIPPPPPIAARKVDVDPPRRPATFDPHTADGLDDIALDQLPFGVVCLAPDGLILRYNLAEGRLARLDPTTVVGRNFFTDVAPCTHTEEFYGRFRRMVEGAAGGGLVRFRYVFDFKFGAQDVDIELYRVPGANRFYLFINRRKFLPAREGPGAREPAPLQAELTDDDETELGIRRNARAERVVASPVVLFEALARQFERRSAEQWRQVSHDWGLDTGRRLVIELETEGDDDERPLRRRPMRDVVERISAILREQGWGRPSFDFTGAERGALRVRIEASALAAIRTKSDRACHFLAGMLEAVLNHLAGRRLHVEEVACACRGDHEHCDLIVVGEGRRDRVAALATSGMPYAAILDALEDDIDPPTTH